MSQKKLKKLFVICLIVLIILLLIPRGYKVSIQDKPSDNTEQTKQNIEINVEDVHKFEKINYNNPSNAEIDYLNNVYSGIAKSTPKGLEIYSESIFSGKLIKIISSVWPSGEDISNLVPEPNYGKLEKIEYNTDWIKVFMQNADKNDAKDYLKSIKKIGFDKNEIKDDGKIMLKYEIENEGGDKVTIIYMKENKNLTIHAKKYKVE